ncbi:carbamoyl-phosphate synthase large subunit [Engelhardtia mirabilis]|uniref:Carbamoyl phosphate synthase large chain n=1 Tax=Engelhardtia mirabilis TaxID=2528011 RepID=A0A518BSJ3_9BACT|nr:Carbamoyl-phosphate synthase large chain [Planctomycetes bacterium Pla133]QDV04265.1 Carbamoyl-phosphate synthase large chain [Planctomycetes bacterium Pla86]
MPKRQDLDSILIIGSGPIVIGQACEFDYSGTQACKALREEGYRVILVNSNPATIMTDPETADAVYVEPITPDTVAKILRRERPDAILPTLGGQTGLNTALALYDSGVLDELGIEMLGANAAVIRKAEDRDLFRTAMMRCGLESARSGIAHNMDDARAALAELGLPCVIRPAFTLGGAGGGIAYNVDEFESIVRRGLELSIASEVLVEEFLGGWKEFEMEVMRDSADNCVIICAIENVDPMGVHTGDSITVAPAQTLTDREYQRMRNASLAIMREIGVECGGSNVQFAIEPHTGRMIVIEMNPRVSRSSALASKATGFPIAKFAAKLAVGYTLDEISNDITKQTPACFEPTIDYVVTKIPRFAFEKFPGADTTLTTQMKSVGEVMSIGRTFKESLQKALRGLEVGLSGLGFERPDQMQAVAPDHDALAQLLRRPNPDRLVAVGRALRAGWDVEAVHEATKIDRWFLENMRELVDFESELRGAKLDYELLREAKRMGYSDRQIGHATGQTADDIRALRKQLDLKPVYKLVDTCAAEFAAATPYYYSTWEDHESEERAGDVDRIMILGGGPNRIGQGIEFDYCCVHAAFAAREIGMESIMVNSNPETVSTDYDTSDHLFFEPLTEEDVLHIVDAAKPKGIIVQFGGQTPLNLAAGLARNGAPLIGTSVESIDRAEDRKQFTAFLQKLGLRQPENGLATTAGEAFEIARRIGYPVIVRPSYVLGGRAMEIVHDDEALDHFMTHAVEASPDRPVLVDKFLADAIEVDVDAISDGQRVVVGGVMEHIEQAGVHSGDSTCVLPPHTLDASTIEEIIAATKAMATELEVIGLMNVQFAVKDDQVYILEVNPRASRTVPFVSKAIGVPLAKLAAKVMCGKTLEELGFTTEIVPPYFSVKAPVFPHNRFPNTDFRLSPEMRSTGEVMGISTDLGFAFLKAFMAAGMKLPKRGRVLVTVKASDKRAVVPEARQLEQLGYELIATEGTFRTLTSNGIAVTRVNKVHEGRPHIADMIVNREIDLVLNTPAGRQQRMDDSTIRAAAVAGGIPVVTTMAGISALVAALSALHRGDFEVCSLSEHHATIISPEAARV